MKKVIGVIVVFGVLIMIFHKQKNHFATTTLTAPLVNETRNVLANKNHTDFEQSSRKNYLALESSSGTPPAERVESIREVLFLDKKVLKTKSELDAYYLALADEKYIQTVITILGRVQEPANSEALLADQAERMEAALFITRAIEWKENPKSAAIRSHVSKLVLDNAVEKAISPELKKSLIADRIELFANLKAVDPATAKDIQESARGMKAEKLVQFANNFYNLDHVKQR